jgi:hypothetical protein
MQNIHRDAIFARMLKRAIEAIGLAELCAFASTTAQGQ